MDNNAKEETSEASMIINREDMQDIFQIEGEKRSSRHRPKQTEVTMSGWGSFKATMRITSGTDIALRMASQSLALTLECHWQKKTKMLHPRSKKAKKKTQGDRN